MDGQSISQLLEYSDLYRVHWESVVADNGRVEDIVEVEAAYAQGLTILELLVDNNWKLEENLFGKFFEQLTKLNGWVHGSESYDSPDPVDVDSALYLDDVFESERDELENLREVYLQLSDGNIVDLEDRLIREL
jgi:hypothetical protein